MLSTYGRTRQSTRQKNALFVLFGAVGSPPSVSPPVLGGRVFLITDYFVKEHKSRYVRLSRHWGFQAVVAFPSKLFGPGEDLPKGVALE